MNSEQNYNENQDKELTKKRGNYTKKTSYTKLKEFEIETSTLNKIILIQRKENKKNIVNGLPELTIKDLINERLKLTFHD
jgi:hypothetical protein